MSDYKKTTVVFPLRGNQILLGMKKRGFGANWWNGYGGKLEGSESYEQNAIREVAEESELTLETNQLSHAADLVFRFDGKVDVVTRAYTATGLAGEPTETDEMRPQWFPLASVPYDTMWPGDDKWIPEILEEGAALPLAYIVDFTANNEFLGIEKVSNDSIAYYF